MALGLLRRSGALLPLLGRVPFLAAIAALFLCCFTPLVFHKFINLYDVEVTNLSLQSRIGVHLPATLRKLVDRTMLKGGDALSFGEFRIPLLTFRSGAIGGAESLLILVDQCELSVATALELWAELEESPPFFSFDVHFMFRRNITDSELSAYSRRLMTRAVLVIDVCDDDRPICLQTMGMNGLLPRMDLVKFLQRGLLSQSIGFNFFCASPRLLPDQQHQHLGQAAQESIQQQLLSSIWEPVWSAAGMIDTDKFPQDPQTSRERMGEWLQYFSTILEMSRSNCEVDRRMAGPRNEGIHTIRLYSQAEDLRSNADSLAALGEHPPFTSTKLAQALFVWVHHLSGLSERVHQRFYSYIRLSPTSVVTMNEAQIQVFVVLVMMGLLGASSFEASPKGVVACLMLVLTNAVFGVLAKENTFLQVYVSGIITFAAAVGLTATKRWTAKDRRAMLNSFLILHLACLTGVLLLNGGLSIVMSALLALLTILAWCRGFLSREKSLVSGNTALSLARKLIPGLFFGLLALTAVAAFAQLLAPAQCALNILHWYIRAAAIPFATSILL